MYDITLTWWWHISSPVHWPYKDNIPVILLLLKLSDRFTDKMSVEGEISENWHCQYLPPRMIYSPLKLHFLFLSPPMLHFLKHPFLFSPFNCSAVLSVRLLLSEMVRRSGSHTNTHSDPHIWPWLDTSPLSRDGECVSMKGRGRGDGPSEWERMRMGRDFSSTVRERKALPQEVSVPLHKAF